MAARRGGAALVRPRLSRLPVSVPPVETQDEPAQARGAAAALLIGAALSGFDAGAVGFVLPALRAATGADAQTASWLVSAYVIGMLVAIPLAGGAAARFGAQRLFRGCIALAAAGALLALLSGGMATLLPARLLQGVGQGPLLPLAATLVVQRWPVRRQGRLVGALSLAYGAAFLAATVVTPLLLQLGWRASFALSLLGAAAAWGATLRAGRAGDAARAATAGIGRSGVAVGLDASGSEGGGSGSAGASGRTGLGALMNREMVAISVLSLGTGVGQALLVWFPTLAIVRLGVAPAATSLLMLPLVAGGIAATVAITAVLDRVGARRLLVAGAGAALLGVLLAVAGPASKWAFMAGAGALGLGITGLCGGPLRYAAARAVPSTGQGPAQSAVALLTNIGLLGGSVLLGALAARARSEAAGVETALLAGCAVMAMSFVALFVLRSHQAATAPTAAHAPGRR